MRVPRALTEAADGLRRNPVMTVAAVLTVSISLGLLGAALILRSEISKMEAYYYTKIEVSVFLAEDVTDQQRTDVETALRALPVVRDVHYETKAEALRRYRLQFADQPELLAVGTVDNLPESFRVKLHDPTQFEAVRSAIEDMPGLDPEGGVVDQKAVLDKLFGVLGGLRDAALALAVVQLLAAALLISNTVRLTAFARRQETALMRLVGASRLQIQLPFLIEGVVAGLGGAVLAVGLLAVGKWVLLDDKLAPLFGSGVLPVVHWSNVAVQLPVLAGCGALIAGAASLLTVRRYVQL
ncbi:MAG: cell division transport system permease protein [Actinomycetota bacterium]|jgi:cell division transport system permease protein|nr:cell division transport system permease protein [Actinomycetota bacterium]